MKTIKLITVGALFACVCGMQTAQAQLNYFSDFNDGIPDWAGISGPVTGELPTVTERGGQLEMRMVFPATTGLLGRSSTGWVSWSADHRIRDGQTLEYRVDLIETSRSDVYAGINYNVTHEPYGEGLYLFNKNGQQLYLMKVNTWTDSILARFFQEDISVKHDDVKLSLSLTGVGESVMITCKVLDRDGSLLFEKTVVDTPEVDPTVGSDVFPSGTPDRAGPPYGLRGSSVALLGFGQFTDGMQPEASVVYDNFTWEYRSAAELNIEPAVRLSWPAFNTPFVVEGAPAPEGPWTPVEEHVTQSDGMNWMTVPAPLSDTMRVFRLR